MKKLLLLLLALSIAANAALLIFRSGSAAPAKAEPAAGAPAAQSTRPSVSKLPPELIAALAAGDVEAIKALGLSDEDARGLVFGKLIARLLGQMREFRAGAPGAPKKYWQDSNSRFGGFTQAQQATLRKLERELEETARKTFGDLDGGLFAGNSRFSFLSKEKREEIQRIERDYQEMVDEVRKQQEGITLSSDRAKLELLNKEKDRDILAALSPEERALDELYASPSASAIRSRYGDLIESEDVYKKVYALQKAFDDQYASMRDGGRRGKAESPEKTAARNRLNDEIGALIGEDAIATYRRENDADLKALNALQARLNLPAGAVDQVYALRDTYAAQSQAINANLSLTAQQRREQLTALAGQAKTDAAAKLGQEGADAYAQRSAWIGLLNRGQAFSTNPKEGAGSDDLRSTVFALTANRTR